MKRIFVPFILVLCTLSAVPLGGAEDASAGALIVSSTADSGPTTLRAAIESANSGPGADVISFDPAVFPAGSPATISVASELPVIRGDITIDGTGAGVVIDGGLLSGDETGLSVQSQGGGLSNVTLRGFTVRGFPGDGINVCGGGLPACSQAVTGVEVIEVDSRENGDNGLKVTGSGISNVRLQDCSATMNFRRGALFTSGLNATDIEVEGCNLDNNSYWGLFVSAQGNITDFGLIDSSVSDNVGLGAYLDSVEETIRPTIDNVQATGNSQMGVGFSAAGRLRDLMFVDSTIDGNGSLAGNGLGTEVLALEVIDATVTGNSFSNNLAGNVVGGVGFQIYSQFERPGGLRITDNEFKGNVGHGVSIITDAPVQEPAKVSLVAHNEISGNTGDGIVIDDSGPITISRNQIFGNQGIGIDLKGGEDEEDQTGVTPNDEGDADEGPNELLNFPVLSGASNGAVQGTACNGCKVELFESDGDPSGHGEGKTFLADGSAVGGAFSIEVSGLCQGDLVTATATDAAGNTSEFSANYAMPADTEGCGPGLIQGDVDCQNGVGPVDALKLIRHDAGLSVQQAAGCPLIGAVVAASAGLIWGDVDCNGDVGPVDGLKVLRFDAGLAVQQEPECPDIGQPLG